jgi:transposase
MKIFMNVNEARKMTIVEKCLEKTFNNCQAANLLGLSIRQVQRLKKRGRIQGIESILHRNRGRKPVFAVPKETRDSILALYREKYSRYNFSHFNDILSQETGIFLSRSSISRIVRDGGFKSPKSTRRPKQHRSREARAYEGELAQMDASQYDWLSNGSSLHLHGAVDDATGKILALHLEKEETHHGYAQLMYQMNRRNHLPKEIYVDRRGVFKVNKENAAKLSLEDELAGADPNKTQFERAMDELGILMIYAFSPQAKGKIERLWGTLQDRLVKDLSRNGCITLTQANTFLNSYIPYYNRKFQVQAKLPKKMYLPRVPLDKLTISLALHEHRKLDNGLNFHFKGIYYRIPKKLNGKSIPAFPNSIVTVVHSDILGMRAILNGLSFIPVEVQKGLNKIMPDVKQKINSSEIMSARGREYSINSPWRTNKKWLFPKSKGGDIITAHLST